MTASEPDDAAQLDAAQNEPAPTGATHDTAASASPEPEAHGLHPLSLLFRVGASVRQLFIPILFVIFASSGEDTLYWVGGFALVSVVHGVFHYLTYRYRFEREELVVRGGVIFRFERHIPYERIQNIDLSQSVFQRLFGVADVRLETASGSQAEARLQVLSLEAVEHMRERVFAGRRAARPAAPGAHEPTGSVADGAPTARASAPADDAQPVGEVVHALGPFDLLAFGLLSNRGVAIVLAALGLGHELGFYDDDRVSELASDFAAETEAIEAGLTWTNALLAALAVVLLMKLLSVIWAFVNLHGFELRRRGGDLQVRAGLLTRHTATLPRRRIQVVSVHAGWLHRLTGFVAVKVDTAGGDQMESKSNTRRWVAPLLRAEKLPELLAQLLPQARIEELRWEPVRPDAWSRVYKRWLLAAGLLAGVASIGLGPWWSLLGLPLLLWGRLDAPRRVAALQWGRGAGLFAVRRGVWGRRVRYVPESKMQVVRLSSSPFDRRHRMAKVLTDTAGTAFAVNIGYLDANVARGLARQLTAGASRSDFAW